MDLNSYISPLRKWWRLLVAATLIAGVTSLIATLWQPNIYAARTTLIVGRSISDPNPDASELSLDSQLAATYAQIAKRENHTERDERSAWAGLAAKIFRSGRARQPVVGN